MKKIKFLQGSNRILTREQHWKLLDVEELEDDIADDLVAKGVAEYCDQDTPLKRIERDVQHRS